MTCFTRDDHAIPGIHTARLVRKAILIARCVAYGLGAVAWLVDIADLSLDTSALTSMQAAIRARTAHKGLVGQAQAGRAEAQQAAPQHKQQYSRGSTNLMRRQHMVWHESQRDAMQNGRTLSRAAGECRDALTRHDEGD